MHPQNAGSTQVKLGEDIIKMYAPYKKKTAWKKTNLNNVDFVLPEYYKPIQLSKIHLIFSWLRRIRCSCSSN